MPLIEEDPPITRPRGQWIRRPSMKGSGSEAYCQLNFGLAIG